MRVYSVSATATLTAARDLLQLSAGTNNSIVLISAHITTQDDTTPTSEQLRGIIQRASAAGTGNALTEEALDGGLGTADTAALDNATTNATLSGAALHDEGFNAINGMFYEPASDARIVVPGGGILVLRIPTTTFGSVILRSQMVWGELG